MSRTVTIDGNSVDIENDVIEHFNRNDELETFEIKLKDTSQLEPYDMGLQVVITDVNTDYYVIGADNITRTSLGKYNHRITLIEAYKAFEREVLPSLQYTQELGATTYTCLDVVDRALKLLNLEKTSDLGGTRVYDISGIGARDSNDDYVVGNLSGFALALYNKKAPEMKFNTPSLREVFDEVFLLFDGRPILENFTTINIREYNSKGSSISLSTVDEITGQQNIDKNAQKFDIYVENGISETNLNKQARVYPSSNGWASVRSSETELTTNNFLMEVNEDIERVLQFKIRADVDVTYTPSGGGLTTFSGEIEVDMTDWLFTERAKRGLLYNYSGIVSTGYPSGQYFNNSMYFSGNQIKGWHEETDYTSVSTQEHWKAFIVTAAYQGNYLTLPISISLGASNPSFNTTIRDFMFRLKYVPKEVVRVQLERDKDIGYGILRANQDARIIDTELLGNNLQSKLNRDGAKELVFTRLNNEFNLNDYYNNYIGTKLDNTRYYNGDVLSTLTLTENYAKKSARIDIANKPRQTQISPENTVRNDIINEYMKVSLVGGDASGSLEDDGLERYMVTLDDTYTNDYPVEFATWDTETSNPVMIECTSQGVGKALVFHFQFQDNITAGKQTDYLDTIYGNRFITYAGANGNDEQASIEFYNQFESSINNFASKALVAQELPRYVVGSGSGEVTFPSGSKMIDLGTRLILKDSGEIYGLTYQITHYTNDDEIFIGNKLSQENALVVKDTETLYVYTTNLPFQVGQNIDNTLDRKEIVTGTPTASQVKIVTTIVGITNKFVDVEFTTNFDNTKYWAIANADGEVYVIVNKLGVDTIYFTPQESRD